MLDTFLQPSVITRLLHLLQAAQPFLTPSWSRLADLCIRLLSISELFSGSRNTDFTQLLHDIRGCTPSNDMNALICAIRPFCSEEELQMLQMYEQFKQMQQAMDMWKMFSDLMPDSGADNMFSAFMNTHGVTHETKASRATPPEATDTSENRSINTVSSTPLSASGDGPDTNPLLAFLSPEQLALYNSILSDNAEPTTV